MDTSVPKKNSEEVASLTKTETVPLEDVTVWIDPLDATKEYSGMFYKTLSSLIKKITHTPGGVLVKSWYECEWLVGCSFLGCTVELLMNHHPDQRPPTIYDSFFTD